MPRVVFCLFVLFCSLVRAEGPIAQPAAVDGVDGVWLGEIAGPNARTQFGLAFTATPQGRLVSVHFPEMFLFSANFGAAQWQGADFSLPALGLILRRDGDVMRGTFTAAKLAVELHRGGTFAGEPVDQEPPPSPAPVWTVDLGAAAWASPVVADATIYVGTVDGRMHAVSAAGQKLWSWSGTAPIHGSAAVAGDTVYFVDAQDDLVALMRADGQLRWKVPLRQKPSTAAKDVTFNHRVAAPVIDAKGVVYVGSDDGAICAVRARSGKLLWRRELGTPVFAPVTLAGEDLWVGGYDGTLRRINRRTQKETLHIALGGPIVSTPVIAADRIIVGSRDYTLYGLTTGGEIAWRNTYWFSWVESTPCLAGGTLYVGGSDYRRVSALNPATGERLWATDVGGLSWGTPVVTEDTVYAATAGQTIEGTVIAHRGGIVALDRATGRTKWRYRAPSPVGAPFTGFAGSLAVAGAQVIGAGVDGMLVALPLSVR